METRPVPPVPAPRTGPLAGRAIEKVVFEPSLIFRHRVTLTVIERFSSSRVSLVPWHSKQPFEHLG